MGIIALTPRAAILSCSGVSELPASAARIRLPTPRARITAFDVSRDGTDKLLILRPALKRTEHCFQVAKSEQYDNGSDYRERCSGDHEPDRPKNFPGSHCFSVAAFAKCGVAVGSDFTNDPMNNPAAARPKAMKPVMFSFQCRKKKGTIAPSAPISIAR